MTGSLFVMLHDIMSEHGNTNDHDGRGSGSNSGDL